MSEIIEFNAREFRFDETCRTNVGSRMFVTGADGKNGEVFEIGDWGWKWSQIISTKALEKDTEYVFRFAVTGGYNDTNDGTSQFILFEDANWEDRYVFPIGRSQYKPTLSKKLPDGQLLRVYEIPFTTGNGSKTVLMFAQQHSVIRIMPASADENYAQFPDCSYEQWWENRKEEIKTADNGAGGGSFDNGFPQNMMNNFLHFNTDECNFDDDDDESFEDLPESTKLLVKERLTESYKQLRAKLDEMGEGTPEKASLSEALASITKMLDEMGG